jgi:HPt (histidine-containing phosphotransfer) domain-containing protein
MIELSTQKQLALLFPHSSKALLQSLQQATPEQLATLSEAKDLSTLLKGLITDTLDVKKSNTIILEILKNSEFFKEMGNFSKELKSLVDYLNTDEQITKAPTKEKLQHSITQLETTLQKLSHNDVHTLKSNLANSGVFWESKLAQSISKPPIQALLTQVETILSQIQHSKLPQAQTLISQLHNLPLEPSISQEDTKPTIPLAVKEALNSALEQFKTIQTRKDPLFTEPIQKLLTQLKTLGTNNFPPLNQLQHHLQELVSELRVSQESVLKPLLEHAGNISKQLEHAHQKDKALPAMAQLLEKLQILTQNIDVKQNPALKPSLENLNQLLRLPAPEKEAMRVEILQFIQQLPDKLPLLKSEGLLDLVHRILDALKAPSPEADTAQKNVQNWVKNLEQIIQKADPLLLSPVHKEFQQLEALLKVPQQAQHSLLQEELQKDLKAMLMQLEGDLPKSTPTEISKQVDKLLVQVEYFQLLSHLSNGSHLYLPLHWNQLDNGHISIKKGKDQSSYCEIDLELCEYGKLNIMLQLFEKNQLNMTILTEQDALKSLFSEHIHQLRSNLREINIMPRNIHIRQLDSDDLPHPYEEKSKLNELGFEVKG